jgi:DNA-binding NtrC family response regulator
VNERTNGALLVIDDDEITCKVIGAIFTAEGMTVSAAHDAASGLRCISDDAPDVVILDLNLNDADGLDVLARLQETHPSLPTIILTAHGAIKSALHATRLGAFDYLTKPIDRDELVVAVQRALKTRALEHEVEHLRRQVSEGSLSALMGRSTLARAVVDQVRMVAASNFTVLVLGATGTGKELVAQAIHRQSARCSKPLIALDCGAIPETLLESELFGYEKGSYSGAERRKEGRFQLAQGGTFFLDEIGNLSAALQAKLLRVLESRQVHAVGSTRARDIDVRFIAATNADLLERVRSGAFRTDLYFRLAQYTISLPSLRSRVADIPDLAQRFLEEASIELRKPVHGIVPEAIALLQQHAWPGNVRELRNVVRQAVLETRELVIRPDVLALYLNPKVQPVPSGVATTKSLREIAEEAAREAERQAIHEVLRQTKGNKSEAARTLRTDYKTLHLKMKSFGIRGQDFDS